MSDSRPPELDAAQIQSGDVVFPAAAEVDQETLRAAMADGFVDAIESGRIYGWAWDRNDPERRIGIDIYHGGQLLETVCADRYRADLKELNDIAGLPAEGDGKHAFAWDIPPHLRGSHPAEFHVCFHGTSIPLGRSFRVAQAEAVASDPDQTVNNIVLALAQRIANIETTVTKAMQVGLLLQQEAQQGSRPENLLPHLGKGFRVWAGKIAGHIDDRLGEKTASLHTELGETARATATAIAQMEGFLLRTDEALKRTARQEDLLQLLGKVRRMVLPIVIAAFAAGACGAALGVWLLSRGPHP